MNRGSLDMADFTADVTTRFNEAPIHESGKSHDTQSTAHHRRPLQ